MKSLILTIALLASVDASARQRTVYGNGNRVQASSTASAQQRTATQVARTKAYAASVTAYPTDTSIVNPSLSKDACLGNAPSQTGTTLSGFVFVDELIPAEIMTNGEIRPPRVLGTCYAPNSGIVYNTASAHNTDRLDCAPYGTGIYCGPSAAAWANAQSEYERRFGGDDRANTFTAATGGATATVTTTCFDAFDYMGYIYNFNICHQLAHAAQYGNPGSSSLNCAEQIVAQRRLNNPTWGSQCGF